MLTKDNRELEMRDSSSVEAIQLFEGDLEQNLRANGKFSSFSQLYSFTSENLSGYMPTLPLDGAKVLTVCGSGDHVVNASMLGADEIVAFDINTLAGFYTDLKYSLVECD